MSDKYIASSALKRLVKDVEPDLRIGAETLEELRVVFEKSLRQHIGEIGKLTKHALRKTIQVDDIQAYLDN